MTTMKNGPFGLVSVQDRYLWESNLVLWRLQWRHLTPGESWRQTAKVCQAVKPSPTWWGKDHKMWVVGFNRRLMPSPLSRHSTAPTAITSFVWTLPGDIVWAARAPFEALTFEVLIVYPKRDYRYPPVFGKPKYAETHRANYERSLEMKAKYSIVMPANRVHNIFLLNITLSECLVERIMISLN